MQPVSGGAVLSIDEGVQASGCGQEAGRTGRHEGQVQHQLGRSAEVVGVHFDDHSKLARKLG